MATAVGVVGLAVAVVVSPPIAPAVALGALHPQDHVPLWMLTALFAVGSIAIWRRVGQHPHVLAAIALSVLLVCGLEIAVRLVVKLAAPPDLRRRLTLLADRTYPDRSAFEPHPFLQFTGRPHTALVGTRALGRLQPFNARGFSGPDWTLEKQSNTIRIAFLGGSTTASGMWYWTQRYLNAELGGRVHFESLSFAHSWYTSNHSVVNLALNALDFEPDYLVFHHGWNDSKCTAPTAQWRGDYSHALRAFTFPPVPDRYLLRGSVLYRWIHDYLTDSPDWTDLGNAIMRPNREPGSDAALAAATFERNVRTVVDLARTRGIRAILVSQPHNTDPDASYSEGCERIERYASHLRAIARSYGSDVLFVDADAALTGRNELFKDVGHLLKEGVEAKARMIADAIAKDRVEQLLLVPDAYPTIQSAIDAARPNQVIRVRPGVYVDALEVRAKPVSIVSVAGPKATIIDSRGLGPCAVFAVEGPGCARWRASRFGTTDTLPSFVTAVRR